MNEIRTNLTTEAYIYEICRTGYIPLIRNRQIIKNGKIVGDEKERVGGGVALLVKDTLTIVKEINLPENIFTLEERANTELVGAEIKLGSKNVNFFSLYNPPDNIINEKVLNFISNQ